MQVTKYPQSCLVIEKEGKRLLIDPGSFAASKYKASDFGPIDAILLTHQHPDHVDPQLISEIIGDKDMQVIGNKDTQSAYRNLVTQILSPGEKAEIAGFSISAYDMPHCPLPDASEGPPNNGYVLDDTLLIAGDSYIAPSGVKVANVAVPIAGPDISLRDARDLIVAVEATTVIPVHYSIFSDEKPTFAASLIEKFTPGISLRVLAVGEETVL